MPMREINLYLYTLYTKQSTDDIKVTETHFSLD